MNTRNVLQSTRGLLRLMLIGLILFVFTSGCMAVSAEKAGPTVENGVIDLRDWDMKIEGTVPLNGHWTFTWLQPLEVGDELQNEVSTIKVPATWGNLRLGNGKRIHGKGIGVYQVIIKHKPNLGTLALHLPNILTAYELSIDGVIVTTRGHIDITEQHSTPYQLPANLYFQAQDSETILKLVVGNHVHRSGGIRTELLLGTPEHLQERLNNTVAKDLFVLGCMIMIAFYHLGLFILRRKEKANLLFAMLCVFVSLRMGVLGESYYLQWLPWITWDLAIRLEYFALIMSGWSGFCYIQMMYPLESRKIWLKLSTIVGAIFILSILIIPPSIFTKWIIVYQLYILLLSAKILTGLVISGFRKREGARLALLGMAGIVLTIINDMLFYNGLWSSIDLVPFGLLFLIVMNSFIISLRFSQTYKRAEQLSAELVHLNNSLEEKIIQRTEELRRSYVTLEEAKTELERIERSRMQLVSNISHDLRTPITLLQGYLEALRDHIITEPEKRDSTIRLMLTKVQGLNSLIQDLFDLSVLEARKVVLLTEEITLTDWRARLSEQYTLELQQRKILFECVLMTELTEKAFITIDIQRMDRVFANLVYNAVRYTPAGGTISIRMHALESSDNIEIHVTDSGVGIHVDDLPHIFDRFYQKDKSRHSSSGGNGLGLSIAKEIVELHGGVIRAYNSPKGGCVFEIRLPSS